MKSRIDFKKWYESMTYQWYQECMNHNYRFVDESAHKIDKEVPPSALPWNVLLR